ncbi:MAG TPA: type II secretion system F family protein [Mycobacteriales bacterium]|jgi:tight adherence protein B|nr:type II secretion system F family protein [Mycobacteriales bacterium]
MSVLLPAVLAGAAVAAIGLPGAAALRVHALSAEHRDGAAQGRRTAGHGLASTAQAGTRSPAAVDGWLRSGRSSALSAGALGAVAGLGLLGPVGAALVAVAAAVAVRVAAGRAKARERELERRHAVEACAGLAAELRAGRTPQQALAVAAGLARGPSRVVLTAAAATAGWGGSVPAALLVETVPTTAVPEVLRGLAACWEVCSRAGSGLAASIERLADGLRARQTQERAVAAALAGPRASAALLAALPLAGIALAAGLGAHPLHVLLHTPLGSVCLVAGVALDGLGLWWTARIVARAAP